MKISKIVAVVGLVALAFCGCDVPGGDKPLVSLAQPFFIAGGTDYHVMDGDVEKTLDAVDKSGAVGFGIELGGLMNSGAGGPVKDVTAHYTKQIAKCKKAVAVARRHGRWTKIVFWNSNAQVSKTVSSDELIRMFELFKAEVGTKGVLLVPVSEFGHQGQTMPLDKRARVVKYITDHWPHDQLVQMDSENTGAKYRETHLGRLETRLDYRPDFICVTDHPVTLSDNLSGPNMLKCATAARKARLSFQEYGKESKDPVEDWNAIGAIF